MKNLLFAKALGSSLLAVLLLFQLLACSASEKPSPQTEILLVSLVNDYLTAILAGNKRRLDGYVVWPLLLGEDSSEAVARDDFDKQLARLSLKRWPAAEHPLLGLEVLDVDIDGDNAEVTSRKAGKTDFPKIWVKLRWSGSGWLVVNDSLFGKHKLAASLLEKQPEKP